MKILSVFALSVSVLTAAPYAGVTIGFSSMKDNLKYSGKDSELGVGQHPFDQRKTSHFRTLTFGLLGGYSFKINEKFSLLTELDVNLGSKKKILATFDAHPKGELLDSTKITSSRKYSFGFMPAVSYNFTDKLSGLVGLRLNRTKHEVTGHITDVGAGNNHSLVKKTALVMGLEPTVGLGFKVNDKIATRLSAGYNFGQKKTMIKEIATNLAAGEVASGAIVIKPRGINIRLTTTYSF